MIVADVSLHLDTFTMPEADALVFTSPRGKPLRHPNLRRGVWYPALAATGLDVHFHDLRHAGNQLTADAGANLRELMECMGHSTSRAALIYLHSTSDRQRQLAETVAVRVQSELSNPDKTGTNRVARAWHDSESADGVTP
jgi:integrase